MPRLFNQDVSQERLGELCGDLSQVAGIRFLTLGEGRESGVRIADVRTGSGLRFQVTLDRGMDISLAEFKGMPLAFRSPVGDAHPAYYEPEGLGWLRTFPGGLITGCGIASAGSPSTDEGIHHGLHGRLSHLAATGVSASTEWEGDECFFTLKGCLTEQLQFSYHLVLHRTLRVRLGKSTIEIRDIVRNAGASRTPVMMIYHCNIGWPVLSPGSRLVFHEKAVNARDAEAARGLGKERECDAPTPGYSEQVFYHDLVPDAKGFTTAGILNDPLGIGFFIRARAVELPFFTQWKMMGTGTYVMGLEPGNCLVEGRVKERSAGRLTFLEPGEDREFVVQCGVLEGEAELRTFMREHDRAVR